MFIIIMEHFVMSQKLPNRFGKCFIWSNVCVYQKLDGLETEKKRIWIALKVGCDEKKIKFKKGSKLRKP